MAAARAAITFNPAQGRDLRYQNESGWTLLSNHDDLYDDLTRSMRDAHLP
jgi:hypothetical protein